MKVLYISNYKDGTGWGNAAADYILAMDAAGIDVVCRSISFNGERGEIHPRILELERKSTRHSDVCIQHLLPHMLDYNGRFKKNIILYETETSNFTSSRWTEYINTMDEAWVVNRQMKQASVDSGVDVPIKMIPHTFDTSKYDKSYDLLDIPHMDTSGNRFVFYFIGEAVRRKNLFALLKAFHLEFDFDEPVDLIIKANKSGMSDQECGTYVTDLCTTVKENLKLYPDKESYKSEFITTGFIDNDKLMRFHRTMNCFIMPSYGEAWCLPAFDAMAMGNTPICTNTGGMADFLEDGGGVLVDGTLEPAFGMTETFQDLYTGREDCVSINVRLLQKAMRKMYHLASNSDSEYLDLQKKGREVAEKYSYESIGNKIKEVLDVN